jgi:hypothetical protein
MTKKIATAAKKHAEYVTESVSEIISVPSVVYIIASVLQRSMKMTTDIANYVVKRGSVAPAPSVADMTVCVCAAQQTGCTTTASTLNPGHSCKFL